MDDTPVLMSFLAFRLMAENAGSFKLAHEPMRSSASEASPLIKLPSGAVACPIKTSTGRPGWRALTRANETRTWVSTRDLAPSFAMPRIINFTSPSPAGPSRGGATKVGIASSISETGFVTAVEEMGSSTGATGTRRGWTEGWTTLPVVKAARRPLVARCWRAETAADGRACTGEWARDEACEADALVDAPAGGGEPSSLTNVPGMTCDWDVGGESDVEANQAGSRLSVLGWLAGARAAPCKSAMLKLSTDMGSAAADEDSPGAETDVEAGGEEAPKEG